MEGHKGEAYEFLSFFVKTGFVKYQYLLLFLDDPSMSPGQPGSLSKFMSYCRTGSYPYFLCGPVRLMNAQSTKQQSQHMLLQKKATLQSWSESRKFDCQPFWEQTYPFAKPI